MEPTLTISTNFVLSDEQRAVFDMVESTSDNILVLGKPGVGKSVIIRELLNSGNKSYTLAAPTGLAALNIGGKTLHSIFRLPVSSGIIGPDYDNYCMDDRTVNHIKYGIRALIIDEISMVRADAFDYIDRYCRHIKGNDKPFGGIQVIAFGDFYQLPPVVVGKETLELRQAGYFSPFIFDSAVFENHSFKIVELHEVHRQKGDGRFLDLLDCARTGQVIPKQLQDLNARVEPLDGLRITLTATNREALQINEGKLKVLPVPRTYEAAYWGDWPNEFPCPKSLELAIGAQVMVKMNGADVPRSVKGKSESRVVNGTIGVVTTLEADRVIIQLESGVEIPIFKQTFERKAKVQVDGKWEEQIKASFEQIPLALAWAISMHKSQGQTFERVHIDPSRVFAPGQLYVAISRAKSMTGITLEHPVSPAKFKVNRDVVRFHNNL